MHRPRGHKRFGSRGMSLVELILVMAILSVVMLAVMSLYVPAQRSTVVQTQVSDVQSNLRLALKVMTQDLFVAGFLEQTSPVVFVDAAGNYRDDTIDDMGTEDPANFVIRTRSVGHDFARVTAATMEPSGQLRLAVADASMLDNFPVDSKVRIFQAIMAEEINAALGTDAQRVYNVEDNAGAIYLSGSGAAFGAMGSTLDTLPEAVVVRVSDNSQPPLQTILYSLANESLERIINDRRQVLARNIDTANSRFDYGYTADGRINRVDVVLTGKTKAQGNDTLSSEKTRAIRTTVKLRNVQ